MYQCNLFGDYSIRYVFSVAITTNIRFINKLKDIKSKSLQLQKIKEAGKTYKNRKTHLNRDFTETLRPKKTKKLL